MISILMPIYNGIEFIDDSVNSIKNQTYENWELLIGINGHSKNSEIYKKALEYEIPDKIKIFDFYDIAGKSNTLNKLITKCNHDHIALIDVDDIWLPEKLKLQINYLNSYDVIGSKCIYFDNNEEKIQTDTDYTRIPQIPDGDLENFNFLKFNPIINSSAIIKKELCWWNNNIIIEDYDLWLRLKMLDKKFYNLSDILVKHRIHNNSFFNSKGNDKLVKKLIKKYSPTNKKKLNVKLCGGFGNILFQFMNAYALSKKYDYDLIFIITQYKYENFRQFPHTYEMFKNIFVIDDPDFSKKCTYIEKDFYYNNIILDETIDNTIFGYFQSYKYSLEYFDEIKNILFNNIKAKFNNINNLYAKLKNNKITICIHCRRGDYILGNAINFHYVIRDIGWYEKSLKLLMNKYHLQNNNIKLLLFSDDISFFKELKFIETYDNIIIENLDIEETFLLMSLCDNFIISNSSFSLLAYYFRQIKNAPIVLPNKWFGKKGPKHSLNDIIEITDNVFFNNV